MDSVPSEVIMCFLKGQTECVITDWEWGDGVKSLDS